MEGEKKTLIDQLGTGPDIHHLSHPLGLDAEEMCERKGKSHDECRRPQPKFDSVATQRRTAGSKPKKGETGAKRSPTPIEPKEELESRLTWNSLFICRANSCAEGKFAQNGSYTTNSGSSLRNSSPHRRWSAGCSIMDSIPI